MNYPFLYLLKQRKLRITVVVMCLLIFQLVPLYAFKQTPVATSIIFTNTQPFDRINEVVSIDRKQFHSLAGNLFPIVKDQGRICITQFIHDDGDARWDRLLIEATVLANSTRTLQVNWVEQKNLPEFKPYTNVRLSLRSDNGTPSPEINKALHFRGFTQNIAKPYYQMEGPGIENDKVAFRSFFDSRNGKDIYGKIVDMPVLDRVGVGGSWHELQPWGMDILRVGNSLGAGALAVQEGNKIYPLADADTSLFETLYEGPLQAAFKLTFKNWDVGTGKQNGSEKITVTKGKLFYKNDIVLPLKPTQKLIAGIAHFGDECLAYSKNTPALSSFSTYGIHAAANHLNLGLAIIFPAGIYSDFQMSDSLSTIPNTGYVVLSPLVKNTTLYFFACWEKTDSTFSTKKGFDTYIQFAAMALANPVKIAITTSK